MKILSRIVDPTAGTIKLHGKVASLLEVGTGFHPELTGRENIYFNGSMIGMSKQEITNKFDEIVAFSEVEKFLDTPVKFYSSGMFVRLAFSVAAHLDSEILILDEVLSVGDASFQKKSLDKMSSITKEGRTILFVSHSMSSVEELCDRAILLHGGKIKLIGKTEDVAEAYLDENETSELGAAEDEKKQNRFELSARVDESYGKLVAIKELKNIHNIKRVPSGSDLVFTVQLEAKKDAPETVLVGIGVADPEGRRIFTHESRKAITLKPGMSELRIQISSPKLRPGPYSVDIGVRSGNVTLDFIPGALALRVSKLDKEGNAQNVLDDLSVSGYVAPEVRVEIKNEK